MTTIFFSFGCPGETRKARKKNTTTQNNSENTNFQSIRLIIWTTGILPFFYQCSLNEKYVNVNTTTKSHLNTG